LARSQLTSRIPQILLQRREIVGELLPVLCQFVALLQPGFVLLLVRRPRLPGHATDTIRLGVLFFAQAVRLPRQGVEFARGLLLLRAAHQARSLAELISRPPRCLGALLLPSTALHLLIGVA
jgi:hypothetical protein